jgi:hypothetical protein
MQMAWRATPNFARKNRLPLPAIPVYTRGFTRSDSLGGTSL